MIKSIEVIKERIIGLRPVYGKTGNACELLLADGEIMLDKRGLKAVQTALARAYAIDLSAQRKSMEVKLGRSANLPFYINAARVFIPLKMRQPAIKKDKVNGYLDVNYIDDIVALDRQSCRITLNNGLELVILSSRNTAGQSRDMGNRLLKILQGGKPGRSKKELVMELADIFFNGFEKIDRKLDCIVDKITD